MSSELHGETCPFRNCILVTLRSLRASGLSPLSVGHKLKEAGGLLQVES